MDKKNIVYKRLRDIDLSDSFFNSLREDYIDFDKWFNKKADKGDGAFIIENNGIKGFLFLKKEHGEVKDVNPPLEDRKWLKIGTFKIDAHGTKLGERFIKIIMDIAFERGYEGLYVTIYDKHSTLVELLEKYGFELHGNKKEEKVYKKIFSELKGDLYCDYPRFSLNKRKYLLAIDPEYHTKLLPDSQLNTEKEVKHKDISYTNSIQKIYLSRNWQLEGCGKGDVVVMYRTAEPGRKAEHSAVATSILVVDEIRKAKSFSTFNEFYDYCKKYTVLSEEETKEYWESTDKYDRKNSFVLKMLYNVALNSRITRHNLIEKIGVERDQYWGFIKLSDSQFLDILECGGINEGTYGY
ncbi:hypothetical protein PM10SUCC1_30850 [Propionigenium maris DSM 9537]|uniref:N-acetyltransferase domain-containing protein n=1 Tax=Propionigenium maris DSM 9537 TaxID=1123000 RepID=A0A9W6LNP2_9FUSO|nr:hypothetical protein [Propionigenium maris]GLI57571.1 hypothetical protein PM10SUCC1_30850 [Propionigenium maris DSM 9537]